MSSRQAMLAAQAQAALELIILCQRLGYEVEMAGTVYIVTRRDGSAVHVTAGEPAEVLGALTAEEGPLHIAGGRA